MARSYRKQPIWKDHNGCMKTIANRKVRRALKRNHDLSLPHGRYKRYTCTYDICDYRCIIPRSFEQYFQHEVRRWKMWKARGWDEPYPDRKKLYREWVKYYRGK